MNEFSEVFWAVLDDTAPDALGFLSKSAALATEQGMACHAVLIAVECSEEDRTWLAAAGAEQIFHLPVDTCRCGSEQQVCQTLLCMFEAWKPRVILFLSSLFLCGLAPALAAVLRTGITADCTKLEWSAEGDLLQSRATFGGRTLATIKTNRQPVIATVRRDVFPPKDGMTHTEQAIFETIPVSQGVEMFTVLKVLTGKQMPRDIRQAEVIFSGGAGLGSKSVFQKLYTLAEHTGGQVAASRGAVAAGYAPFFRQVGQTGIIVRPRLYVAFGISGAVQHLSGMIDAKCIVAVNPDHNAPIHQVSDYSICADGEQVIDALISALEKHG